MNLSRRIIPRCQPQQKELTLANDPWLHAVVSNFVIEFIHTSKIYMQEAASSPVACDHFLGGYLSYQRRQPEGGLVAFLGSDCAEL